MKNVADIYPLSPMQELMLIHAVSNVESDVLFNQVVYRIEEPLDETCFRQAWQAIVARHPVLRTVFLWEKIKQPVQVVRETAVIDVHEEDLRGESEAAQTLRLEAFLADDLAKGFKLTKAPLMRFALLRMADDLYHFVWSSHHLIVDRWCISLLMGELQTVYAGYRQMGEAPKRPLTRPYRDYIAWLKVQDIGEAERVWREELKGIYRPTGVLAPRVSGRESGQRRESSLVIGADTVTALRYIGRKHQVTLNTFVLGAWAMLHLAQTPQQDVLLGVAVAGRPSDLPHVETIIGSFINNVPLRASWRPTTAVIDWLNGMQRKQLAGQAVDYISPLQLQAWSEMGDGQNLLETLYIYQAPVVDSVSAFRIRPVQATLKSHFPMTLSVTEDVNELLLQIVYDDQKYDDEQVVEMLALLSQILHDVVKSPHAALAEFVSSCRGEFDSPAEKEPVQASNLSVSATSVEVDQGNGLFNYRETILQIWRSVLVRDGIKRDDDFFALGGTSLQAVQLFAQLNRIYGTQMQVSAMLHMRTVDSLADHIALERGEQIVTAVAMPCQTPSSYRPIPKDVRTIIEINRGNPERPKLFLIHNYRGHVLHYRDWAAYIGDDQPVYGIYADIDIGETSMGNSINEMADIYLQDLLKVQPTGPYFFVGWSGPGLIIYEIASRLMAQGERVDLLALIRTGNPAAEIVVAPMAKEGDIEGKANALDRRGRLYLSQIARPIRHCIAWVKKSVIDRSISLVTLCGGQLSSAMIHHVEKERKERFKSLCQAYFPPAYPGRVVLFKSNVSYQFEKYGPDYGWGRFAQCDVILSPHQNDPADLYIANALRVEIDKILQ